MLTARVFWVLFVAVLLSTIHTPLHGSQFVVMLNEQGLDAMGAARIIFLRSLGSSAILRKRMLLGVTSTYSSSAI